MEKEEGYAQKVKRLLGLCILGAVPGVLGIILVYAQGYEIKLAMSIGFWGIVPYCLTGYEGIKLARDIVSIYNVPLFSLGYESIKIAMAICDEVIFVILLVLSYIFSKNKEKAGPILGIILGVLDIIHLSIYGIVVGIYIIIHCESMRQDISGFNKNNTNYTNN